MSKTARKVSPVKGSLIADLESAIRKCWHIRYNVVAGSNECAPRGSGKYEPLDDRAINSIFRRMQSMGLNVPLYKLKSLLDSDFVEPYNPIEVYFNSLPAWDGKTDYIGRLADTVPVSNKTYWESCFRKWIVGVVGCALEEHFVNHQVLVLVGRQGIRKSTFINNLLPPALRDYIYSGHIDPRDKDCVIHLGQRILINFDEMEGLNRRNLGLLKELITKQTFNLRKPYGRKHERFIRRASFAGSVNNFDFLLDETGNRRFLGIEVTGEINTEHGIDIDGVMAQALHLYKHEEFCPWFTLAEIETVEEQNDAFRGRTMQEEALLCCFERCSVDEATERLTATEVLAEIHRTHGLQIGNRELQQLGRAMRAQGFVRYKTAGQWKYAVRRVAEKRASFSSAQS